MTNTSKIEQFGFEEKTRTLATGGVSTHEIADALNRDNPKANISHMAVYRWIQRDKVTSKVDRLMDGENLNENLRAEFRERINDLDFETQEIYSIMRKALKRVIKQGNDIRTIKAARDTLDAIDKSRKNLQALIQNGIDEYRINEGAIKQTTINVDKVLINFSKELCPACRKKVVGLVIKEEEEKEEEDI